MSRNVRGIIVFAGVVVLFFAGIFMSAEQDAVVLENEKTQKVVLPVTIGGGDASWESCMNEVAALYMEENKNVQVEIRTTVNVENIDYNRGLVIEEAKGEFDGIVEMRNVLQYEKAGKLAALPESLTKRAKQVKVIDGNVYSIPRYYSCYGIIYNREIFEQAGLEEPETYGEFLEVCESLKEKGITPLTVGAADLWHLDHWCRELFHKDVLEQNPDWIAMRNKGSVHWTDSDPVRMLTEFEALFRSGYVDSEYDVISDADTIEQLTEGKAAMLCSGTWMFSQIMKVSPQFEIGWFFLPDDLDGDEVRMDGGWEWAITENCRTNGLYDTAVDFLEFYYSADIYRLVLQSMSGVSSMKEDIQYEAIPVQEEIVRDVQQRGVVSAGTIGTDDTPEGFANEMYIQLLKLAKGEQSVGETAEILDKKWEEALEKE